MTRFTVLVEDQIQQNLVRRLLEAANHALPKVRFLPLPGAGGSGEHYVRSQFPIQVTAQRKSAVASTLIAMIDADTKSVDERRKQLVKAVDPELKPDEPILILIPKRAVETWIQCALGESVSEETDYTKAPFKSPDPAQIKKAAKRLVTRAAQDQSQLPDSPDSLNQAWELIRRL